MPVYEYICHQTKCVEKQGIVELNLPISSNQPQSCPLCSLPMERLISPSSFILSGKGWAKDGYAK